jgi:hypothetical protein
LGNSCRCCGRASFIYVGDQYIGSGFGKSRNGCCADSLGSASDNGSFASKRSEIVQGS